MREIWDFSFNFRLIIITVGPLGAAIMHMAQLEEDVSLRAKTDRVIY